MSIYAKESIHPRSQPDEKGWRYSGNPEEGKDCRALCTIHQDSMVYVGICAWDHFAKRWTQNGQPLVSGTHVHAWQPLLAPARYFFDGGQLIKLPYEATPDTSSEGVDVLLTYDELIENGRRGRRALACDTRRRIAELIEAAELARYWLANCQPLIDPDEAHPLPLPVIDAALAACRAAPADARGTK